MDGIGNTGTGRFGPGDGEYPAGYDSEDGGRDSDVEEKIRCAACNRATQQPDIQVRLCVNEVCGMRRAWDCAAVSPHAQM
jgi:hypothetical protein